MSLPEIETESDLLKKLKFKNGDSLNEKEIKKIISTGYTKEKENIIEISGLIDIIGIKDTIKYLNESKESEKDFNSMLKNSPIFNNARRKYYLDITSEMRSVSNMIEGIYKCPKCNSKKVKTIQKQTRGSDESTTEFNSCVCGYNWKSQE